MINRQNTSKKNITLSEHSGFCFGVSKAVDTCKSELLKAYEIGERLYCLGELIHNKYVIEKLSDEGLITVQSVDEVPENSSLLIRAHGEPPITYEKAAAKNIKIIDATCPFVARIHRLAEKADSAGRELIVIGDSEHPEVKGILGCSSAALGAASDEEGLKGLLAKAKGPLCVVSQTTMSAEKFNTLCALLPEGSEIINTICNATKERQDAAFELSKNSDAMIVIGGPHSSNSQKLAEICEANCTTFFFHIFILCFP